MSRQIVPLAVVFAVLVAGCAAQHPPSSLVELEQLVSEATEVEAVRLEAARDYLARARTALADREWELADRMSVLGIAEVEMGSVQWTADGMEQSLLALEGEREVLLLELEKVASELAGIKQVEARRELRAHIEAVIEKAQLKAAATEELAEAKLSNEERKNLSGARLLVARELLAAARLRAFVVQQLVATNRLPAQSGKKLDRLVAQASGAVNHARMAEVYQFTEQAVEEYRLQWEQALANGADWATREETLRKALVDAEVVVVKESLGLAVVVPMTRNSVSKEGSAALSPLAALAAERDDVLLVAIGAGSRTGDRPVAQRASQRNGAAIVQILKDNGAPEERVTTFTVEFQSPLRALAGERSRACVLLVLLP